MSDLTYSDVVRILTLVDQAEGVDLDLRTADMTLKVKRAGAAPVTAPAQRPAADPTPAPKAASPADSAAAQAAHPDAAPVSAPMSGTFYATPAPGKPPFVTPGQAVRAGDQLGIVEVMKLFTPLTAEVNGTVVAVLVENQQTVAKDDVLMLIEPGPDHGIGTT